MAKKNVWLIGAGLMAQDYAKVLKDLDVDYSVIGRGKESAQHFKSETGKGVQEGGIDVFLKNNPERCDAAIVAVGIEALAETTLKLLDFGVKEILLEKPGVGYPSEIDGLVAKTKEKNANVLLAYNRRFYASVLAAQKIIKEDGGVTSFNFEFTEWAHVIKDLVKDPAEHQNWFLGNSSHIIDMAFFMGGKPKDICCFYAGEGNLDWHKVSSNYTGAGVSESNALFAYHANWEAPGRWVIEVLTKKHRLVFKPIEKLQIQKIGSVAVDMVEDVDYSLDEKYKPGLFLQTKKFLEGDYSVFCDIFEQAEMMDIYKKMSGYS